MSIMGSLVKLWSNLDHTQENFERQMYLSRAGMITDHILENHIKSRRFLGGTYDSQRRTKKKIS